MTTSTRIRAAAQVVMLTALAAWAFVPARAAAQRRAASPEFGATADVQAPLAATNAEDATASGSTVSARDRRRALEEVSEALVEVPGLRVTDSGGAGSFSGVALRGGEIGHTAVLLDAIPLTTADTGAFDLSVLPLSALDRVEVYRGGAPAWLGEGSIGGVVRFVPGEGAEDRMQATAGAGSYGRRELRATSSLAGAEGRAPSVFGHVRLLSAENDYPYVDDGGTRFDASDDRERRQHNADNLSTDGLLHTRVQALGGQLALLLAGHGRLQGIPGPLASPPPDVRAKLVRTLAGLSYLRDASHDGRRHRLQLVASGSHQVSSFSDRMGQLGISDPVEADDVWQRGYLRAAGGIELLPFLEPTVVASFTLDLHRPEDALAADPAPGESRRTSEAIVIEPRLHGRVLGMRAELRPSLRAAWSQLALDASAAGGVRERDEWTPTYRIAGALEPVPALTLASSFATGTRVPSLFELFGDRIYQEANPDLGPERSRAVDASVVLRGERGALGGSLELRGFALFIDDLIRFEHTAQYRVRPENVDTARILGIEVGLSTHYGRHLALSSSLTAMDSENQFGRTLPFRPPLQALVRPEVLLYPGGVDRVSAFAEVHHVSFVYLDDDELAHLPARTLLSVGASVMLFESRLSIEARVHNLLDDEAVDLLSRPLPGRDLRVQVTVGDEL